MRKEYDLKGTIRSNSIIMCEMMITSDNAFFNKIGLEEGAKYEKIEVLKKLTNFENTKKVLDNIKLELPETPDINDIKLIKLNRLEEGFDTKSFFQHFYGNFKFKICFLFVSYSSLVWYCLEVTE